MSRNKSVLAVLFVCCFRLFTAFLIKAERKFNDTSFNDLPGAWKNQTTNNGDVPPYFDWRQNGGVTPVKDQGQCNACWAFSAVAAIESQYKIYMKRDLILSEQFLLDCNHLAAGCSDANLVKTYGDIASLIGGVMQEGDYRPYSQNRQRCGWDDDQAKLVAVTGYRRVKPLNEVDMMYYLCNNGPLSAGINDATMVKYGNHNNDIDEPTRDSCSNDIGSLNHAVLIVGYDTWISDDGNTIVPYWIIKNSWGTDWGDRGYYYLRRGINACGIANDVIFPFVP